MVVSIACFIPWRRRTRTRTKTRTRDKNIDDGNAQTTPVSNAVTTRILCGICFEELDSQQMFKNQSCSHSFCVDCTRKHIVVKLEENAETIFCPGVGCKCQLDIKSCQQILPNDVFVKWNESLHKSLVSKSQKCPFEDCLAVLPYDSRVVVTKAKCPACQRWICASCSVSWHSKLSCEAFQERVREGNEMDELVKKLAEEKNWRKCPLCKLYVEKNGGCSHITCRCRNEFCYRCGANWSYRRGHICN